MPHIDLILSDECVELLNSAYESSDVSHGVVYRIDESDPSDLESIRTIIDEYRLADVPHLCVRETVLSPGSGAETNPHYHGFMLIATNRYGALRAAIKRIWPGQKGYMLKKSISAKAPHYFNYMCKGTGTGSDDKPDLLYHSEHFTEDLIKVLNTCYWKNKADIQSASKKRRIAYA